MPAQVKSKIVAPIVHSPEGESASLWGLLVIHACVGPRQWEPEEAQFLQQIANQLAVAVHQTQLLSQLQQELQERQQSDAALAQQLRRSTLLSKITQKVHESLDSLHIFETAVTEIRKAFKVSRCNIFVFSSSEPCHFALMFHDYVPDFPERGPELFPVGDHEYLHQLMKQSKAIVSNEAVTDPLLASFAPLVNALSIQSMVGIQTSYQGKINGAITVSQCDRIRAWLPEEVELLSAVATRVGIALAHANLLEQEQQQRQRLASHNQRLKTEIEERQQAQQLLHLVMDAIPQAIFWKDRESRFMGCNQAFAEDTGFNSPAEIRGKTDQEMPWTAEESEWYQLCDREVMNGNKPEYHILESQLQANGNKIWLDTNKIPLHNSDGEVTGILGTYEDITDRMEVEAELQRRLGREQLLSELTQQIHQSLHIDQILSSMIEQLCSTFQVSRCTFFSYEPQPTSSLTLKTQTYSHPKYKLSNALKLSSSQNPFLQRLLSTDQAHRVSNSQQEDLSLTDPENLRAFLAVRTAFQGQANGVIFLDQCHGTRNWTEDEKSLLEDVAAQIGIAIAQADLLAQEQGQKRRLKVQNHRLQQEITDRIQAEKALAQQLQQAELLEQIVQQIRQSLEPQLIFRTAVTQVRQLLEADRVSIYRFSEGSNHTEGTMVAEDVLPDFPSVLMTQARDRCFGENYADKYQSGQFQAVADIYEAGLSDCHIEILAQFHIRANLVLPLIQGSNLWGLICIHQCASPRSWQPSEIEFLQKITTQLSIALYQSELLLKEQHQRHILSVRSQELAHNNQQLEIATHQAEAAQQKSDQANRAKSTFLANMSHELRTPLNAILGFSQLISRDADTPTQHLEQLEIINRSGEHLLALINDVLTMSKIEAGQSTLHPQVVDFPLLLETVESMLHLKANSKGLRLSFHTTDFPRYIRTDPGKLRQVLMNLLSNAIKFTTLGEVSLSLGSQSFSPDETGAPSQFHQLLFTIQDTGPGIAANELERLFEPFSQTETGRQSQEGTGLGLTISRQFVQLMGGDITVQSTLGQGTTFTFDIVVEQVERRKQPRTQQQVMGLQPHQPQYRILVVEDNADSRELLVTLLETVGFAVAAAENGDIAIKLCQSWQPNLVWMDLRLPIIDGLTATRRIKQMENPPVIIALTANAFDEDRESALQAGCDDFVHKPYRDAIIFEKMALHLEVLYHYEDKMALISSAPTLNVEQLAQMSQSWLKSLHEASNTLDQHKVEQLLLEIDASAQPLQQALSRLAFEFRYDEIIAATKPLLLDPDTSEAGTVNP